MVCLEDYKQKLTEIVCKLKKKKKKVHAFVIRILQSRFKSGKRSNEAKSEPTDITATRAKLNIHKLSGK